MKLTKGKTKRILLSLLLCGYFTGTAHAAMTYDTAEVTEETKSVTYTDADGNEQTYNYTTKTAEATTGEVTGLEYSSKTDVADEIYYAWTDDGFVEVDDASSADVTATYGSASRPDRRHNAATIDSLTGDYVGDTNKNTQSSYSGGAIRNQGGTIGTITANFVGNYATEADEENNPASRLQGGAISNESSASIESITANFIGNYVEGSSVTTASRLLGGAIANQTGTIGTITGSFIGNYVEEMEGTTSSRVLGGAISNEEGTIGDITGDFIGNHITGTSDDTTSRFAGGAIFNMAGEIGNITGDFIGNYVESAGYAYGSGIFNAATTENATIKSITGDFIGNYTIGDSRSYAGAVYNSASAGAGTAEIGSIKGDFIGNYAVGDYYGYAWGAIVNTAGSNTEANTGGIAHIGTIEGDFIGNYIENSVSSSYSPDSSNSSNGAAIYNRAHAGSSTYGAVTVSIDTIKGNFIGNHIDCLGDGDGTDVEHDGFGGAIANQTVGHFNDANSDSSTASIGSITGDFIGNYVTNNMTNGYAMGGAIANLAKAENNPYATVNIGSITGSFYGNYVENVGEAHGGAIYNYASSGKATIGDITGSFIENHAKGSAGYGGAIYNYAYSGEEEREVATSIGNITGSFISNYAESTGEAGTGSYGGAIFNENAEIGDITGDFIGNHAKSAAGDAHGGAIYNTAVNEGETSTIKNVTGTIAANYAEASSGNAYGGAIYNHNADFGSIKGALVDNYATSDSGNASGGAIYSDGVGLDITGDIVGNYAVSKSGDASGGAVYNNNTITITGNMNDNYVKASGGTAAGGAIYNDGENTMTVTGDIKGNYAEGSTALGGAIYNAGGTLTITGNIQENYTKGDSSSKGGAIYNAGGTLNITGDINGNHAEGSGAAGGVIYNESGTVNLYAVKDMTISGNYAGSSDNTNFLYGDADSETNFIMTDSSITLLDNLDGEEGYIVNVEGNGTGNTTFYFLSDAEKSNISFNNTTLNTINNEIHVYNVNKFTVAGDFNMVADVDLKNETMDRFVTNGNNYGEAQGKLNVSGMNIISDTDKDRVGVYFAEPGLKEDVTSSVGSLPGSDQQKAYSPIYAYDVSYDKNYDGSWGDDGGYFVFDKTGINPAAQVPSVAQMGAYGAMSMLFEYCFEHSDYYMKLPSEVRLAIREKAKAAKAAKLAEENGTTVEAETKKIEDARAEEMASREGNKFYDHDNVLPEYDQHELTRPGAWVKPFSAIGTTPYKHNFTSRDKYYGMLVGVDTDVREGKDGWANVFTGYAGYQGIHQSFAGNGIRQDGGVLGVTETFYKKNFYTAWTAAVATTRADGRTMYGHDKSHLYTMGIASKSGWNMEYDGGKYAVLPTFMVSYTNVNMRSYTNAAGLRMDADNLRAVQLNPNVKWIRNMENGWQPYLTVGEIWTVSQRSRVRAAGHELPKLCLHPYTEYGIGVQKRWANDYDGYAQILGHAGGRRGALLTLGFRWTFN